MFLRIKWINQFSEKEHQHESYNLEPLSVQGMSQKIGCILRCRTRGHTLFFVLKDRLLGAYVCMCLSMYIQKTNLIHLLESK